jgi:hypothetical protein
MPDDRLFHIRLLQSDKVDRLTDFERCVWFACRLACDDFGVMRFSANTLQEAARFIEKRSRKVVEKALDQVRHVDLLRIFSYEGRVYCYQHDWNDWQKVDYPRSTLHPKPPDLDLETCSLLTQQLFALHPGGWRGKKQPRTLKPSEGIPKGVPKPSEGIAETFRKDRDVSPTPSAIPDRKPLAVSLKPLAISPKPLAVLPAAADRAEMRSKRPICRTERFVIFEWQFDDIRQLLGPHLEDFLLDEWFESLSRRIDSDGLVISKNDIPAWVYNETVAEAKRRGLTVMRPAERGAPDRVSVDDIAAGLREARERGAFDARQR